MPHLKLVGSQTFHSKSTGKLNKGDVVYIEDEDLAEKLLEKGTQLANGDDHFLRPTFVEVSAPKAAKPAATRVQTEEELQQEEDANAELARRLGSLAPQAPVGQGENQAESLEPTGDVDSEDDGAKDPAYHEGQEDDQEGDEASDEEGTEEGTEEPAKPATRVRQRATATKPAAK